MSVTSSRVYIAHTQPDLVTTLRAAGEWVGVGDLVRPGIRLFLKPNLTWKVPMPGVTTTPVFIRGVVAILKEMGAKILIGEADGGYHSFKAEEAFKTHGLYDLQREFGISVVNLSAVPSEVRRTQMGGREVSIELPCLLLNDIDVFVSLPVPKVHVMTRVSLGLKNQWGCQPGTMRLRNHPGFAWKILAINRVLNPRLVLYDGTYFLDRSGPMVGEAVRMDLVVAADHPGAGDLACCAVMGIEARSVAHLRLAQAEGMAPLDLNGTELNQPLEGFKTHRFALRRAPINYVALAAFHSHLLTRMFYDSRMAGPLHTALYRLRRNPLVGRLLYGRVGPPQGHE